MINLKKIANATVELVSSAKSSFKKMLSKVVEFKIYIKL